MSGWVTVALAGLAVAGTVAGVVAGLVIAGRQGARREERRWERDRDRDELRQRLDRDQDREQRRHDERLAAYTQYIEVMSQWELAIGEVAFDQEDDAPVDPVLIDRMDQYDEQIRPVLARITLVGSASVQAQAQDLVLFYARAYRNARAGDPVLAGEPTPGGRGRPAADVLGDAYLAVVDDLRRDLGVEPVAERLSDPARDQPPDRVAERPAAERQAPEIQVPDRPSDQVTDRLPESRRRPVEVDR